MMIVAIPRFKNEVAPSFEVARRFLLAQIDTGGGITRKDVRCAGCGGFGRIELLKEVRADVVICNGIGAFYRDLLRAMGLVVIPGVNGRIDDLLDEYLRHELVSGNSMNGIQQEQHCVPLKNLVRWTRELFISHGYTVHEGAEHAAFPVDLVAEITCPLCRKLIRVAICCGAHTYWCNQEIKQFHRVSSADFQARVYVHTATPQIRLWCREYDIELIDPNAGFPNSNRPTAGPIPILQRAVRGHEEAFRRKS